MSFLFGSDKNDTPAPAPAPAPAPVPESPSAVTNEKAQMERQEASDRALAESRAAGRQQTVSAGRHIAEEDQQVLGTKSARKRASRDIVG